MVIEECYLTKGKREMLLDKCYKAENVIEKGKGRKGNVTGSNNGNSCLGVCLITCHLYKGIK